MSKPEHIQNDNSANLENIQPFFMRLHGWLNALAAAEVPMDLTVDRTDCGHAVSYSSMRSGAYLNSTDRYVYTYNPPKAVSDGPHRLAYMAHTVESLVAPSVESMRYAHHLGTLLHVGSTAKRVETSVTLLPDGTLSTTTSEREGFAEDILAVRPGYRLLGEGFSGKENSLYKHSPAALADITSSLSTIAGVLATHGQFDNERNPMFVHPLRPRVGRDAYAPVHDALPQPPYAVRSVDEVAKAELAWNIPGYNVPAVPAWLRRDRNQ